MTGRKAGKSNRHAFIIFRMSVVVCILVKMFIFVKDPSHSDIHVKINSTFSRTKSPVRLAKRNLTPMKNKGRLY